MSNHLVNETSPYLLQHANNPVDWYPWCEEAFQKAKREEKPVFLSIGYSTCHWCHVMAHESFEDREIAELLNREFVSIKVDKEERPDIDSVYMTVCQALTGSGGWPTTIFMTPEQKPFMAGTYFPPTTRMGRIGFWELLQGVSYKWKNNRQVLLNAANQLEAFLCEKIKPLDTGKISGIEVILQSRFLRGEAELRVINSAIQIYKNTFDKEYGGFGVAPKFPAAHNLLFLMRYYEKIQGDSSGEKYKTKSGNCDVSLGNEIMEMVDKTLLQMYRGGMFDHIGGGFSRYSTDRYFLVPHFEKMLYDNALLIMAYAKAYELTSNVLYRGVAEKTADFVMREMTSREGGFYSAQDADSEGVEGKYYVFEPIEIMRVLGRELGKEFCAYFDITKEGNFEGKSIPNLLKNDHISAKYNPLLETLYEYRKKRCYLHMDDKILTSWNGLMIAALCQLYKITQNRTYLDAAKKAQKFVETYLYRLDLPTSDVCMKEMDGENEYYGREKYTAMEYAMQEIQLYVSSRNGVRSGNGFLDDYANEILALLALYEVTLDEKYLMQAKNFCTIVVRDFWDEKNGGFFLSGSQNEALFIRSKETYDGAMPSGNSMMAYNLVKLYQLTSEVKTEDKYTSEIDYEEWAKKQLVFMEKEAAGYPTGYAMALMALLEFCDAKDTPEVVCNEYGCMLV